MRQKSTLSRNLDCLIYTIVSSSSLSTIFSPPPLRISALLLHVHSNQLVRCCNLARTKSAAPTSRFHGKCHVFLFLFLCVFLFFIFLFLCFFLFLIRRWRRKVELQRYASCGSVHEYVHRLVWWRGKLGRGPGRGWGESERMGEAPGAWSKNRIHNAYTSMIDSRIYRQFSIYRAVCTKVPTNTLHALFFKRTMFIKTLRLKNAHFKQYCC